MSQRLTTAPSPTTSRPTHCFGATQKYTAAPITTQATAHTTKGLIAGLLTGSSFGAAVAGAGAAAVTGSRASLQ